MRSSYPNFSLRGCIHSSFVLLSLAAAAHAAHGDVVDDFIKTRMQREHIPGLSVVVIRDGKIVKERGYGYVSLELKVPARSETVYELASTTKPLMATAIRGLVVEASS